MITITKTLGETKVRNVIRNNNQIGILTPNFLFIPTVEYLALDYIELKQLANEIETLEKEHNHNTQKFFEENGE